jgi:hypothetical protein
MLGALRPHRLRHRKHHGHEIDQHALQAAEGYKTLLEIHSGILSSKQFRQPASPSVSDSVHPLAQSTPEPSLDTTFCRQNSPSERSGALWIQG